MDINGFVVIETVTDNSSNDNSRTDDLSLSSSNDDNVIFPVQPNQNPPQQRPMRLLNLRAIRDVNDGASDSNSNASSLSAMSVEQVLYHHGARQEQHPLVIDRANQLGNLHNGEDDGILEMQVDIPRDASLQHRASLLFAQDERLHTVNSLAAIGVTVRIVANGNCFYSSLLFGMYHLQVHPYYLPNGTPNDRVQNLAQFLHEISNFRRNMKLFLEDNMDLFTSDEELILSAQDSLGNKLRDFATSEEVIMESVGDRIFVDGHDYTSGCGTAFWADVNQHLPVAALFLRVSIACYFTVNGEPHTTLAYYSGGESGEVTLHYLFGHYYTPPSSPTICLHYLNGNHFNYIRLHSYNGDTIGWDDLPFDPTNRHHDRHDSSDDDDDDVLSPPSQPSQKGYHQDTKQHSYLGSNRVQELSKGALNYLGRNRKVEDYDYFSHFSQNESGRKVHFTSPKILRVNVPAGDLRDKLCVTVCGGALTHVSFHSGFKLKGDYIRQLFCPVIPPHLALRANNSYTTQVGKVGPGKRTSKYVVCFNGWCQLRKQGCPTTYKGGITSKQLLKLVENEKDDPFVEVELELEHQCVHNEDAVFGQCRGRAREEALKEVRSSKKFPKEMAKSMLANMNEDKLVVNNHHGLITSPSKLYNINRENKRNSMLEKGINPKEGDIANIMSVVEQIQQSDLQLRKNINDQSEVLLGIARKVQLVPELGVELYSRHLLNFVGELSLAGQLVIGIDGTGGLVNFKNTNADGKIQHIIVTIQLSQCLLDRQTSIRYGDNVFTPVIIAERISDKNNATSIASWLSNVIRHTTEAMESYPGGEAGHILQPIVVQMDCALELMNACIASFRRYDQVDSAARYNSCVIIIVLRYEYLCSSLPPDDDDDESQAQTKMYAEDAYRTLLLRSPSVYKQCKTHISSAISGYPSNKPRNKLPRAMRNNFDPFERIFRFVAAEATQNKSLSQLIARLCVVVTILRTEYLPCESYTIRSGTQYGHTLRPLRNIAEDMHVAITNSASSILISEEEGRDDRLRSIFSEEGEDITFSGDDYCADILNSMEGMPFSVVYLNQVNKRKREGVVKFVFVISPYRVGDDGVEKIHPRMIGGIHANISLPHKESRIRNPLHCQEAADYIVNYWLKRVGLWSESVMHIVNTAVDKNIFSHNNSTEGTFSSQKNAISEMYEATSNLASYVNMRWQQCIGDGRLARTEIQLANSRIDNKKRRREAKSSPASVSKQRKEMNSEMKWKRTPGTIRGQVREFSQKVVETIELGNRLGHWKIDTTNKKAMWRALSQYSDKKAVSMMSYDHFLKFMKLELNKPLRKEWRQIIDKFSKQFD